MNPRAADWTLGADGQPARAGSGGRPDAPFPVLPTVRRQVGTGGVLASVVAKVNLTAGSGAIAYVYPVTGLPISGIDPESAVVIRAAGTEDATLAEFGVQARLNSELEPGDAQEGLVSAVLPLPAQTRALFLVIGGSVADAFRVAGPPPGVRAIRPMGALGRQLRIGLDFERPLETGHTYAVQVSADGGRTWQTTGVGLTATEVGVDTSQLRRGQEIRVRVITTNGTATSETTSDPVRVENPDTGLA